MVLEPKPLANSTCEKYVPRMIQWYREGLFPIDRLIKFYRVSS